MKGFVIGFDDRPSTASMVCDWASDHLDLKGEPSNVEASASSLMRRLNELLPLSPDLIIVCGRTGVARDQFVPQTLAAMADYEIPGLGETMRRESVPFSENAALCRGGVWLAQKSLLVAVPGKDRAAIECLSVIKDLLIHASLAAKGACKSRGRRT